MRTWSTASLLLISWLGLGCGGPAEPPVSPESAASADDAAPSGADAAEPAAATDDKSAPSAGPASEEDVNAILQLVVDDPELDKHLNLGEPGRFPLQISGDNLPGSLKIVKATEPVKVVGPPKSKKDPVLVLTEMDIKGDKATVRYRYDVEGIRATVTLSKSSHGWELKNSRLVEH